MTILGGNPTHHNDPFDGYRRLSRAIIETAVSDAKIGTLDSYGRLQFSQGYTLSSDLLAARRWLTTPSPILSLYCAWVEIDPTVFTETCLRRVIRVEARERFLEAEGLVKGGRYGTKQGRKNRGGRKKGKSVV